MRLNSFREVLVAFLMLVLEISLSDNSIQRVLSRKKRYAAFPEGSSFTVALCTTIGAIGNPNVDYMSYALNWAIAYDLPNETWARQNANGFKNTNIEPKPVIQRRHRRELYNNIEIAINSMGYDGRQCILRAICESSQLFYNKKETMTKKLVRLLLSFPRSQVLLHEHNDMIEYSEASSFGAKGSKCSSLYSKCSFSLLELALGK